jgi:hypothetical protein
MTRVYVTNIDFNTPLQTVCDLLPTDQITAVQIYKEPLPYKFGYLDFRSEKEAVEMAATTLELNGRSLNFQLELNPSIDCAGLRHVTQLEKIRSFLLSRVESGCFSVDFSTEELVFLLRHIPALQQLAEQCVPLVDFFVAVFSPTSVSIVSTASVSM